MATRVRIDTGVAVARRAVPRALRAHAFASALVVAVLIGGGLRFIPAAVAGSNTGGHAPSTACAAS